MRRIAEKRSRWVHGYRSSVLVAGLALAGVVALGGCKRGSNTGELEPPSDAEAWENRFGVAFDDAYTREPINLVGRAPHDVLDQRLFAARLGHSAIVARVSVDQVWGRGRHEGDQDQYMDVTIEQVLMGELPKNTNEQQLLPVRAHDELSPELQGEAMILFVRWAPGAKPPFHHHLMPSDPELEGYIESLIEHAQGEGVIDGAGNVAGKKKKRKKKKKKKRGKAKAKAKLDVGGGTDMPADP
ncbi:MAG: hypothetical protein AAF721_37255 [Myxococcota bacterium]